MPRKKDQPNEGKATARNSRGGGVKATPVVKAVAKPKERRTRDRSVYKSPLGLDVKTLEETYKLLEPSAPKLIKKFYKVLFQRYPQVKPMFAGTTLAAQERKLLGALNLVIKNLRQPDVLVDALRSLGERHRDYGAVPEHYAAVSDTMLDVLKEFTGDLWTEKIHDAWALALETVSATMLTAYGKENSKETTMSASKKAVETGVKEEEELTRLRAAIEGSMTAVMMVDLDFNVTFVNDSTMKLLKQHQAVLADVFPGFDADQIMGTCIDQFHKNPSHQRKLLADKRNLPYQTDINVKDLKFALNVTGQYDLSGNSIGYTLEWSDVTELRNRENHVARLQGSVDASMQATIMVDRDFVVTYANEATLNLLNKHKEVLKGTFTGFDADSLIGSCIDMFHKDPSHQRKLLSDPKNLPYKTDISIGDLQFELNVTATMDGDGVYVGNSLEWSDVTELRNRENHVARLQGSVDASMQATIMVDRDFVVTYANEATLNLLNKHKDVLKGTFPGFDTGSLIGSCIDMFHKDPSHQRKLLSDPKNLPYKTDISIGDLQFELNVTATMDGEGNYVGNSLEWSDVTALRERESNVARLQGTIDGAMTAMMMIDRDFIVTYANNSTLDLLRKHETTLRSVYPGFSVDKVLGACIDMFHSNPAHQRQLLSDPRNLPYQTDISIGELQFALNVTAIFDAEKNYVGNALEWSDVTETRAKEIEVARLQSAVDGAQANLMLCDNDLNITYANPAVVEMLRKRESELRKLWPGMDVNNLVGQNIDQFHKNPSHQRALLQDSRRLPATAEIKVDELEFRVNASMIKGPSGEYMGNMVQWNDITEEKDAERQVRSLVDAAVAGDFTQRIDVSNYSGFIKQLGELLNNLVQTSDSGLNEVVRVLRALAVGDLTETIDTEYQGLFGQLKDDSNMTVDQLREMVGKILQSAGNITSAAGEIAQGNQDLSQRTEEQASSLEETASSMEELTSTVKQNADNARQANQLAASAREQAEKGGDVVGRAVSAMGEINSASKKIADIIGVIDEIAFQTNLLALNAAVEAARAGEQGRGFAVVAGEVRNLAQRSATAAKEIKSLIQDSVEKVDEGSKLVDESGSTLTEIVGGVKKVSDIIAEIAAASQEQSSGIEQVNKAVMQMDEVTQQNAALVEEAAAASESLDEQAKGLSELMLYFTMDKGGAGNRRSAPGGRAQGAAPGQPARRSAVRQTESRRPQSPAKDNGDSEWEDF